MKVWVDLVSGDEMCSDANKFSFPEEFNGACLKVKANYRQKKGDQIIIASDEEAADDEEAVTVVDLADASELFEMSLKKKDVMAWGK